MKLLNDIMSKELIGGRILDINSLFNEKVPINDTYYWDDGTTNREGAILKFKKPVLISKIIVYSTNTYPLGDVRIECNNKTIYKQEFVSRTHPLIYEGSIVTKQLDIMRYTVKDSVFQKILIYGDEIGFLLKENDKYYSIKEEYYNKESKLFEPVNISENITNETIYNIGFNNLENICSMNIENNIVRPINQFNNFQIISSAKYDISVYAKKSYKELIVANNDFSIKVSKHIDYFSIKDFSNNIKIIFSIDEGTTWKSYYNNEFIDLDIKLAKDKLYNDFTNDEKISWDKALDIIYKLGIDSEKLLSVDFNVLDMNKIRFGYLFYIENENEDSYMKQLSWQFDSKGIMELCDKSEVKIQLYYGGVKLVSNIDISLLKTNITYESINSI